MICVHAFRRPVRRMIVCALALAFGAIAALPARAQGKVEAHYVATLVGIPVGKGSWVIDIADDRYTAAASGITTGLAQVFTGGQGSGAARGKLAAGMPVASSFSATLSTRKKSEEVRMTIDNGAVKDFAVKPPQDEDSSRIPVTETQRRGILDPMTASLVRTPGNGDPVSPIACQRNLPIFDGRFRFDLQLVFKRIENVKADKGYAGPAVVCAVYFSPIAGHIPSRKAVKYLAKMRDLELWLVPVAGTRVLVPFRVEVPTPFGLGVVKATTFVTVAKPKKTTANDPKAK